MGCNITCIHGFSFFKVLFFINLKNSPLSFERAVDFLKPLPQKQAVGSDWLVCAGVL